MYSMKKLLCLLLAAAMLLSCAALAEPDAEEKTLQPGDALHGFTVAEVYDSSMLNSTIITFNHDVSGATLVYIQNDDPEVAFTIG